MICRQAIQLFREPETWYARMQSLLTNSSVQNLDGAADSYSFFNIQYEDSSLSSQSALYG
jgi:hypothetical protein